MVVVKPKNVKKSIHVEKYDKEVIIPSELYKKRKHKDMANRLTNKSWNFISFTPLHTGKGKRKSRSLLNQRIVTDDSNVSVELPKDMIDLYGAD